MVTITFGSTGTYPTFNEAYAAHTWTDDLYLQQSGVSWLTGQIAFGDFAGHSLYVKGDGNLLITGNHVLKIGLTAQNGDMYFDGITFSSSGQSPTIFALSGNPTFSVKSNVTIKYCIFNCIIGVSVIGIDNELSSLNIEKIDMYGCHIRNAISNYQYSRFLYIGNSPVVLPTINIENCTSLGYLWRFDFVPSSSNFKVTFKNTYSYTDSPDSIGYASVVTPLDSSFFTSTAFNINSNENLPYSTDTFISIQAEDDLYFVPKTTSVLYTGASQTTNIAENTIGLNGYTITNRVAGAYAAPDLVSPPTAITVTDTFAGVKIDWTDTVTTGYEKVYIYWETVPIESAFTTSKASVNNGVQTYTIPYNQLQGANHWYIRLAHGA